MNNERRLNSEIIKNVTKSVDSVIIDSLPSFNVSLEMEKILVDELTKSINKYIIDGLGLGKYRREEKLKKILEKIKSSE
jgi:hypothetical protein